MPSHTSGNACRGTASEATNIANPNPAITSSPARDGAILIQRRGPAKSGTVRHNSAVTNSAGITVEKASDASSPYATGSKWRGIR